MTTASLADDQPAPATFAGIPFEQWGFAARVWLAMMLALAAAFWLQLDSASSAAVTVAILAQPRRGQALRKAAFRVGATVVGSIAAIAITGIFSQSRDLFLLAYATWMGLAVFIAAMYDGNRAYGAVLSGYTVAIIAVINIDQPTSVFDAATARLAVVCLGIAATALVSDVFAAPTVYPDVRERLRAALDETRAIVRAHLSGDGPGPEGTVTLVGRIVGLRLDVEALPSEAPSGVPRRDAANSASVAMISALSLSRAFAAISRANPDLPREAIRDALEADDHARLEAMLLDELDRPETSPKRIMQLRCAERLARARRLAGVELEAMEAARPPERPIARLPIHRDREAARRKALYVFIGVLMGGTLFVHSSWPQTAVAFAQIGIFAGLAANAPDTRAFLKGAMIAVPCAFAVAGITEYLILDGVDAFPLLALGMAPAIFLCALMVLRPTTSGIGFLMLVYTPVIFPPSNPQSYDPESFLYAGILSCAGVLTFGLILFSLPPTTVKERRRWLVNRARRDVIEAASGACRRTPEAMRYLIADRLVALSQLPIGTPAGQAWRLAYLLTLSNYALVAIRAHDALDRLGPLDDATVAAAREALEHFDADALDASAVAIARADPAGADPDARATAIADLCFAAGLRRARGYAFRHLRSALPA